MRLLVCATWFQTLFRAGTRAFAATPLWDIDSYRSADDILAAVPRPVLDDVFAQTRLAGAGALADLRARTTPEMCIPGAGFTGSKAVGGADADLIADGWLIDVKSTVKVATLSQDDVYQLLGYLLIDLDDTYRIDTVGLYVSRAGSLVTWSVTGFLSALNASATLPELRGELAELAGDGRLDEPARGVKG